MKSKEDWNKLLGLALASFGIFSASVCIAEVSLELADLEPVLDARGSGSKLMALSLGLHHLESDVESATHAFIGVHGHTQGHEWVQPLQTINDDQTAVMFFRWDLSKCPRASRKLLTESLEELLENFEQIDKLTLVGHSLGGVLVSTVVSRWKFALPTDVHVVAAPLAEDNPKLEECASILPEKLPPTVRFFQWRTQHQIDLTFKDLEVDPQIVSIEGSLAITLPTTFRERSLGHNWSLSFVADRIARTRKED